MSLRWLRILAGLILAFSIAAHAQSLGDVARQTRAELQQSGTHLRVITNDDFRSSESASSKHADSPVKSSADGAASSSNSEAKGEEAAAGGSVRGGSKDETGDGTRSDKPSHDPEKEREARELEAQARTQQINQHYLDRIAELRQKISDAQKEIARIQRDQVESTIEFQRSVGSSPSLAVYQEEQRLFNQQLETQRSLITSLNSQLEDAQESARHAGVPHATD
jgi:hypothetical protein